LRTDRPCFTTLTLLAALSPFALFSPFTLQTALALLTTITLRTKFATLALRSALTRIALLSPFALFALLSLFTALTPFTLRSLQSDITLVALNPCVATRTALSTLPASGTNSGNLVQNASKTLAESLELLGCDMTGWSVLGSNLLNHLALRFPNQLKNRVNLCVPCLYL
jgi:hypothetical protein